MTEANILLITNGPESGGLDGRLQMEGAKLVHISALSLSLTEGEHPDADLVVVADSNSKSDELELCRRVRAQFSAPILALTRFNDEAAAVAMYNAGVDECMPRSISCDLLQAKLTAWLSWLARKAHDPNVHAANLPVHTPPTAHIKRR